MKRAIRIVIFFLVFALVFVGVDYALSIGVDRHSAHVMRGFYDEREGSLDAVYLGSSNCLAFWNSMVAWEQYGITVHPFSNNSQQFTAAEYLIKEARKTQPDAVFVVNVNTLGLKTDVISLHRMFDNMPFSLNKLEALAAMTEMYDLTGEEKQELYFPILRYHSRWGDLKSSDFTKSGVEYKGAFNYRDYWQDIVDISKVYKPQEGVVTPPAHVVNALDSLLDYCDAQKVKVVFVTVPRVEDAPEEYGMFRYVSQTVEQRGYHALDLTDKIEELNFDLTIDYYNKTHTNAHGAVKFTQYVSEYLIENFGFENKKNDPAYSDWNKTYDSYLTVAARHLRDFELAGAARDMALTIPANVEIHRNAGALEVSFDAVKGATKYVVCKRVGENGRWKTIGETKALSFADNDFKNDGTYYYTVVPAYEKDGETVYGNFHYNGISVTLKGGKVK